jgi:hypothetical protein
MDLGAAENGVHWQLVPFREIMISSGRISQEIWRYRYRTCRRTGTAAVPRASVLGRHLILRLAPLIDKIRAIARRRTP